MDMGADNSIILEHLKVVEEREPVKLGGWLCYTDERASFSVFECSPSENEACHEASQNLKLLRHPSIVKYVASGARNGRFYLMTEKVQILRSVLRKLSPFAACAGLRSVLEALAFLHDAYGACHNNLDLEAICVSSNGTWKVLGMECLNKYPQCTEDLLAKTPRNPLIISPEEGGGVDLALSDRRDIYAFGVTAKEILTKVDGAADLPGVERFLRRIDDELLCPDPSKRPSAAVLLDDAFFKNDFVDILLHVKSITLKSSEEKRVFFGDVAARLSSLPGELVASHLLDHLLARVVLVDPLAGPLLPWLLRPSRGDDSRGLFGVRAFSEHVLPRLAAIFEVHDASVRMVLLDHFEYYAELFSKDALTDVILPQLLLGLKDVNDALVAKTLSALSILVRLVGGQAVVGGERRKYFSQGNPKEPTATAPSAKKDRTETVYASKVQPREYGEDSALLQERSSPDGGESTVSGVRLVVDEEEEWSDWEGHYGERTVRRGEGTVPSRHGEADGSGRGNVAVSGLGTEFDVKSVKVPKVATKEDDIFASMEPVITFENRNVQPEFLPSATKFQVEPNEQDGHGWDVDSE